MEYNIKNVLVTRYSNQMNSMICNKKSEIDRIICITNWQERWSNLSVLGKKNAKYYSQVIDYSQIILSNNYLNNPKNLHDGCTKEVIANN